jgi:hypothetical protein
MSLKTCFIGLFGLYIGHESDNSISRRYAYKCFHPCAYFFGRPKNIHSSAMRMASKDCSFGQLPRLEQQLLLEELPCDQVDPFELVQSLRANDEDIEAALEGLQCPMDVAVLSLPAVLTPEACALLREFSDRHLTTSDTVDAMDGEPECRVELDRNELTEIIGADAVRSLWSLPALLDARRRAAVAAAIPGAGSMPPNLPPVWLGGAVLRRYNAHGGGRTMLGFHVDSSDCTANVCLSPPAAHAGGALLLAAGGRVAPAPERSEGGATVHAGDVAHGVARVTAGVRHSLLVFFQRPGYLFQSLRGRRRTPASPPS